eukprot:1077693_1
MYIANSHYAISHLHLSEHGRSIEDENAVDDPFACMAVFTKWARTNHHHCPDQLSAPIHVHTQIKKPRKISIKHNHNANHMVQVWMNSMWTCFSWFAMVE